MRQQLAKMPTASITQRLETLFCDHNHVWMHGAYANHSGAGEYITDASGKELLFLPDFGMVGDVGGTPKSAMSAGGCYHQSQSDVDSSMNIHKYEVDVLSRGATDDDAGGHVSRKMHTQDSSSPSSFPLSANISGSNSWKAIDGQTNGKDVGDMPADKPQRDKAVIDKTVMKKKWSQIGKNLASLVSSIKSSYGGVSRMSLDSVHEHLSSAFAALPLPSDMVLGMELNAQLHQDVPKVVESYIMCKEWVGEVYDTLCPLALVINEVTPCDFKKLKQLLSEGEGLPFRCVFEENQLKRVLKEVTDLVTKSKVVLCTATEAATALNTNLFENHIEDSYNKDTSVGGGSRNRSKAGGKSTKKNMSEKDRDDLKLSNLLGKIYN
jgi:hypothetical protein